MHLVADGGSTKTAWAVITASGRCDDIYTQGINPFHQTVEVMTAILSSELLPLLPAEPLEGIAFYGSGCTKEKSPLLERLLKDVLGCTGNVFVGSDMLGAAHALCGRNSGIACILGTGSNSCLYDGTDIVENVSPLGYILGDEGSGAYIGKRLVGDVLKGQVNSEVSSAFFRRTGLTAADIIEKVYRQPMPNRFLASLVPFVEEHRDDTDIHNLLVDCFRQFFVRNIEAYHRHDLDVNFIGSIASIYRSELEEAAASCGFTVGKVMQSPLDGMVDFETN
jgi:N-acetylglucosamine kinase-like BadF-type ATPase